MTQKEKAEHLYNLFYDVEECEEHVVCERVAKACAIICAKELNLIDINMPVEYYHEVIIEIKKL